MGAFYVNFCVRGLDQNEVLAFLRQRPVAGFVGPTQDGWTSLVAEDIEMQDPRIILDYGRRLTEGSDRVAMGFLCHDEDLLHVWLFRGGARVGEFDSCPAYFGDPGEFDPETMISSSMSEDLDGAVLVGERAFMEAFGLDAEGVRALLPQNREDAARQLLDNPQLDPRLAAHLRAHGLPEGPLDLHERWAATLGLPLYSVAMGFRSVEGGESEAEWGRVQESQRSLRLNASCGVPGSPPVPHLPQSSPSAWGHATPAAITLR